MPSDARGGRGDVRNRCAFDQDREPGSPN